VIIDDDSCAVLSNSCHASSKVLIFLDITTSPAYVLICTNLADIISLIPNLFITPTRNRLNTIREATLYTSDVHSLMMAILRSRNM
jgi:hypothetical protein